MSQADQLPTPKAQLPRRLTPGVKVSRTAVAVLAALLLCSRSVLACPVCFGASDGPMIDGTKLGVLVLLVITFVVQGGFVGFFFYLRKRAKQIADVELDHEWSKLQGASRT